MPNIMWEEPLSDMNPQDLQKIYSGTLTEKELATAYALSSNEFWWVEDNVYDYEEGTQEYKEAVKITEDWRTLMECYEEQIFDILRNEGVEIPTCGRIVVLAPFMKRNGYLDGNGWWIEE